MCAQKKRRPPPKGAQRTASPPVAAVATTRGSLLAAAKRLFAAQGYDGTSVKQIADLAGVNVSLVSYHFGGKENLYRAILLDFGQERLAPPTACCIRRGPTRSSACAPKMFADEMLRCHLNDPELSTILHRALELGVPLAQDVFRDTFLQVFGAFGRFIAAAQKRGLVQPELHAETLGGLLFGSLVHAARADNVNEIFFNQTLRNPAYRAEVVEHFLALAFPRNQRT